MNASKILSPYVVEEHGPYGKRSFRRSLIDTEFHLHWWVAYVPHREKWKVIRYDMHTPRSFWWLEKAQEHLDAILAEKGYVLIDDMEKFEQLKLLV